MLSFNALSLIERPLDLFLLHVQKLFALWLARDGFPYIDLYCFDAIFQMRNVHRGCASPSRDKLPKVCGDCCASFGHFLSWDGYPTKTTEMKIILTTKKQWLHHHPLAVTQNEIYLKIWIIIKRFADFPCFFRPRIFVNCCFSLEFIRSVGVNEVG